MRSHGMSTRPLRRLGTRQQGDSPGHGTCRSPFLEPPAQSISPRAPTTNRKRPVEAAGAVDAKNAPTAPWETGRPAFHSYHRLCLPSLVTGRVSPMFPVAPHRWSTTCVRGVGASDLGRGYGVSTE
jgi:hypothetical protein